MFSGVYRSLLLLSRPLIKKDFPKSKEFSVSCTDLSCSTDIWQSIPFRLGEAWRAPTCSSMLPMNLGCSNEAERRQYPSPLLFFWQGPGTCWDTFDICSIHSSSQAKPLSCRCQNCCGQHRCQPPQISSCSW